MLFLATKPATPHMTKLKTVPKHSEMKGGEPKKNPVSRYRQASGTIRSNKCEKQIKSSDNTGGQKKRGALQAERRSPRGAGSRPGGPPAQTPRFSRFVFLTLLFCLRRVLVSASAASRLVSRQAHASVTDLKLFLLFTPTVPKAV